MLGHRNRWGLYTRPVVPKLCVVKMGSKQIQPFPWFELNNAPAPYVK